MLVRRLVSALLSPVLSAGIRDNYAQASVGCKSEIISGNAIGGRSNLVITDINGGNVVNLAPDILNKTQFEWAPDSKRIVFVSESTGNAEIYTVEPDGDHLSKLTSNRLTDAAPHWSRNGKSILFLSESAGTFSLYTMGRDGDNQKKINLAPDAVLESDW